MPDIHPTAIVDDGACLGRDVEVGPFCIVESDVSIGARSVLRPHSIIKRHTTLGEDNLVDCHAVLGGLPQDLRFDPATVTHLKIGSGNTFRECVTISRATRPAGATVVGDRCYFMANSHAGHDAVVGSDVILANSALVGGHARVGDRVFLSANVLVHQYCWIGEGVICQGNSATSMHVPPYTMLSEGNCISSLNVVGMKRNPHMTADDHRQLKEAFKIVYRSELPMDKAVVRMDEHEQWGHYADMFRRFIKDVVSAEPPYARGLCPFGRRSFTRRPPA